jgi:hypothetical protein
MEETMIAARKALLLGLAALGLLASLSGCVIAERPGHYREGPGWHQSHWNNGWQGGGGDWNHYN